MKTVVKDFCEPMQKKHTNFLIGIYCGDKPRSRNEHEKITAQLCNDCTLEPDDLEDTEIVQNKLTTFVLSEMKCRCEKDISG